MAKAKGKATTPKKGGSPSAEVVEKSITDANAQTEEDLSEIFGDVEDKTPESTEEALEEEELLGEHLRVKPTVEKETDADEDDESTTVEEKPTQAAEEVVEEETPPSLDQAALMELLPEKFRGEDLNAALQKLGGSYGELESQRDRDVQELAQATKIIKALAPQEKPAPKAAAKTATEVAAPAAEEEKALMEALGEVDILEDPITPLKTVYAMARQAAAQDIYNQIGQYDALKTRFDQFNDFKAGHADFDSHKDEMLEVIQANKHLDDPAMVEVVYKKAKELKMMRADARNQQTTEQVMGSDQLKAMIDQAKAEAAEAATAALMEKLQKGQAMKGTLESGSGTTPTSQDRTGAGGKDTKYRITTDHGRYTTKDEELAGIIAAEQYDDQDLLNL